MQGDSIIQLELCISETDFENGVKQILKQIRPTWKPDDVQFRVFTEGFTNRMIGCYVKGLEGTNSNSSSSSSDGFVGINGDRIKDDEKDEEEDLVLIRVNSQSMDNIVNRKEERENFRLLSHAGLAPPIYCVFGNGMAYGFFPGVTLDTQNVREPAIKRLIAEEMVRLHRVQDPSQDQKPRCELRARTQALLDQVPAAKQFSSTIPSKSELQEELTALMDELDSLGMEVVFSHNDPLNKNIIYNHKQGTVRFIDYEYAFNNYEAFDIGDHFSEYPGMDVIDYSLYPCKDEQLPWLQHYLECKAQAAGRSEETVTANDVERLYVQVNKCALAAHFYWGVWSLIQAEHSTIDYNYIGFANTRLTEYFKRKKEFLPLKLPV